MNNIINNIIMLIGSMLLLINCNMAQAADTTSISADSMLLFENEIDNLGKETDNKKEEKEPTVH
jgi:hypothetical protein